MATPGNPPHPPIPKPNALFRKNPLYLQQAGETSLNNGLVLRYKTAYPLPPQVAENVPVMLIPDGPPITTLGMLNTPAGTTYTGGETPVDVIWTFPAEHGVASVFVAELHDVRYDVAFDTAAAPVSINAPSTTL